MINHFRERVIESLRKHPEGLTILDIASNTGINRITASKYVFGLLAEGLINQRRVGTAKLCYLKVKR